MNSFPASNLITNAIQATQPGGAVTITTRRAGDRVEIGIADTGSGIPADRQRGRDGCG